MNKKLSIMASVIIFSIAMTLIDAFVHPNYFVKIPIKILFFLALPFLFFIKNRELLRLRRTYLYSVIRKIYIRLGIIFKEKDLIDSCWEEFCID